MHLTKMTIWSSYTRTGLETTRGRLITQDLGLDLKLVHELVGQFGQVQARDRAGTAEAIFVTSAAKSSRDVGKVATPG
jgi:hypothetical protein